MMQEIEELNALFAPTVLLLAAGVMIIIFGVQRSLPKLWRRTWWRRVLPLLPLALGVAGAFLPGIVNDGDEIPATWGSKVLVGLWAGFISSHLRKVIKRFFSDKFDGDGKEVG